MEIASAVSAHENIYVKQGFFGFRTKVYYKPTLSEVDSIRNYYTLSSGNEIQQFLLQFQNDPSCAEKAPLTLDCDPNGTYRLEVYTSRDGKFLALQLFRYAELEYHPVNGIKIYEGEEAALLKTALLEK